MPRGALQVKPGKEQAAQPLTTRREALSLYRAVRRCAVVLAAAEAACAEPAHSYSVAHAQVLRASPLFVWRDDKGVPWRDTLRQSARKEFEAARRAHSERLSRCQRCDSRATAAGT